MRATGDPERFGSHSEQTSADADQTAGDTDQTVSDADALASRIDQALADSDQAASDRDQAASDRDHAPHRGSDDDYEISRLARLESTLARDRNALLRLQVATQRDRSAERRDELARLRDISSEARDRASEERDRAAAAQEARFELFDGLDALARKRLDGAHRRIAEVRARAAEDREQAARDREQAAKNRREAAKDRRQAEKDRRMASIDDLTGAVRRGVGLRSFARELERSRRTGTPLSIAFIDVDGLKLVNDTQGHAAGDALLNRVGKALITGLRPYDTVVRFGGDEFTCMIAEADESTATARVERIAAEVAAHPEPTRISSGVIEVRPEETVLGAVSRADAVMRASRINRMSTAPAD